MPLNQITSRNVFLTSHKVSNKLCQSLTVAIIIVLQVEEREYDRIIKSKSCTF